MMKNSHTQPSLHVQIGEGWHQNGKFNIPGGASIHIGIKLLTSALS